MIDVESHETTVWLDQSQFMMIPSLSSDTANQSMSYQSHCEWVKYPDYLVRLCSACTIYLFFIVRSIYIIYYLWNIYGIFMDSSRESNLIWFSDRAQSFGRGAAEHTSSTGLRTTFFLRDVRMNLQRNTHTFASHCCTYQIHPDTVAYHIFQAMVAHPMVLPARNSALQAIV